MPNYTYPKDGRLHTRYSDLVRATPAQVENLVQERFGIFPRFENQAMKFGTFRHKQLDLESKKTGYLPKCFKEVLPKNLKVSNSEYYFETPLKINIDGKEIEVVIHSTCDAYLEGDYIVDYKITTQDIAVWGSKQQLVFYAYLLGLHGIKLKRTIFLTETWDIKKTKIIGYQKSEKKLADWKIKMVKQWIDERVFALIQATDMFLERNPAPNAGVEEQDQSVEY